MSILKYLVIGFTALIFLVLVIVFFVLISRQFAILRRFIKKEKPVQILGRIVSVKPSGGANDFNTVDIVYTYEYNGISHRSDTIFEAGNIYTHDYTESDLRKDIGAVGDEITVYLDPSTPRLSWLVPERSIRKSGISLLAIVFIGYFLYILIGIFLKEWLRI